MGTFHLDVVPAHNSVVLLEPYVEHAGGNWAHDRVCEFWFDGELPTKPWQKLVLHRWMNVRSYKLLKLLGGCGGELQDTDLLGTTLGKLHIEIMRVPQILHKPFT